MRFTLFCKFCIALTCVINTIGFADDAQSKDETAADSSTSVLLRYKFNPGQKLRYSSVQTMTLHAVSPAGEKIDRSRAEQIRVFTVNDVSENGEAKVSMQFEHVRMESRTDDNESVVYDSAHPDQIPSRYQDAARKLKGAAPSLVLQPEGTPISEQGIQDTSEASQACFTIPLPEGEVSVGDSWKAVMPVKVRLTKDVNREILLLRTYKLKSVDDNIAEIEFFTSIQSPVKSPQVKAQLLQSTPKGSVVFDIQQGRVLSRSMRAERSVLGVLGPNTMLSGIAETTEKLVSEAQDVTSR